MDRLVLEKLYWGTTDAEISGRGVFDIYYGHLQHTLLRGIEECRKGKNGTIPILTPEVLEVYTKQMQRITIRTLIFEMELCEDEGKLIGVTIQERYRYYEETFLKNPDYLKGIYKIYPQMYQGMMQILEDFIWNIDMLIDRFMEDREGINQNFFLNRPCKEISRIGGGSSDSHRQGSRVFILELDNGEKLVYKPRSLAVDEAYKRFLEWVAQNVGMSFWWNLVWDRQEYGWCQWVNSMPCKSREEIKRYYCRNGVLLCVSYLLGSKDMHYENLIAYGEYPILVDLEMAVGSHGIKEKRVLTETERLYRESVLQTGLLPLYTWNENGEGVNVGALNGKGGQLMPVAVPVVTNSGTVHMRIAYRRPTMGEGKNLATLNSTFVEPYEFLKEIQEGFRRTYHFLTEHRKDTMEMLELFRGTEVRYLVRDTQQYSMLLMILGHPDLLTENADKQAVWDTLKRGMEYGKDVDWIQEQECQELMRGDVPYFYYDVCKKELCSGTGKKREAFFENTAIQCIRNRLERMCAADMERQAKLIQDVLFIGTKAINRQEGKSIRNIAVGVEVNTEWKRKRAEDTRKDKGGCTEGTQKDIRVESAQKRIGSRGESAWKSMGKLKKDNQEKNSILAAEKIADTLLEEAIWSKDRREVGWISIMMVGYKEKSYLIRPMNPYLYGGLAGMAVFMAELAQRTGKAKYHEMESVLVQSLFRHTDGLWQREEKGKLLTGAYSGEASIALSYLLLYSATGDAAYLTYVKKQCQITTRWLEDDQEYDVLGGNAGAILVFLKAYQCTGETQYLAWAKEAGDCLLQSATVYDWGMGWVNQAAGTALTGFAHGTAGIMLALVKLGYETQEEKYMYAAYQAYEYEENYYMEDVLDWKDLREGMQTFRKSQSSQGMAWCHGWGGIVMARLAAARYVKGKFKVELEKSGDFIRRKIADLDDRSTIFLQGENFRKRNVSQRTNLCLCHGWCGNMAMYEYMGEKERVASMRNQVIEMICSEKAGIRELLELQECENYGLLGGIAGIGYGCLCNMEKVLKLLCIT